MTLSITSLSQADFIRQGGSFTPGGASLQLSFESDKEAMLAKQALWISKFFPAVFSTFPKFRDFDPTLSLPKDVREKAVRIFPRSLVPSEEDDVTGVVSSLYGGKGELIGSLVNVAWTSPLIHAFMLYELLTAHALGIKVRYDSSMQQVHVNILKKGVKTDLGFWFGCILNQIQTFDLQESLEGKGYLGLAFPISTQVYGHFVSDTVGGGRSEIPKDFFEKQIVNDWLVFHLSGEKIVKQSFELRGKTMLRPEVNLLKGKQVSPKQWLAVAAG